MAFVKNANISAEPTIWERYAHQFPVRANRIYLNHAAVSPLCKPAADAMKDLADDCLNFGSVHYEEWLDTYEGLRVAAARLIGANRNEIASVKNTSEGIATVAMGLNWKPGDRIVAFREEFPANFYPWKKLEEKGAAVTWLSVTDPLEKIEQAAKGARLLSISFVQFLSGYRAPIREIGEICHRNQCIYMVDAIQGMGAFPIDVRECHIDTLAADGHKWMMGPEGCGILYISEALQDQVDPVEFGWTNVAGYNDYGSRDMTLRPDAGRYECGTLNTIGIYGLRAAIEFLLEVDPREIAPVVQNLADRIAEGVQAKGYELFMPRTAETGAGIVSFRKAGVDAVELVARLRAAGISVAPRAGWVRTSPHFYVPPQDIERFLAELD
ncbi:MAG TPA: aminotransferase class V-fold PLP-dependent enzyme [Bryobacteraceae bacterium]|jgi:selenocysteine lyase/cysteine desulfurase|nr:aminotransferase class V-fold PLP-dependent enzyme [Bryobacteraceae bacterium]